VCSQADTFWGHLKNAASMHNHCKEVFLKAAYATSYVSTYPGGQIGFALGSLDEVSATTTDTKLIILKCTCRSSGSLYRVLFELYYFFNFKTILNDTLRKSTVIVGSF